MMCLFVLKLCGTMFSMVAGPELSLTAVLFSLEQLLLVSGTVLNLNILPLRLF
jgi:hypothetical protein